MTIYYFYAQDKNSRQFHSQATTFEDAASELIDYLLGTGMSEDDLGLVDISDTP